MFQLDSEFYRLPLQFDAARLAEEVLQFSEDEWCPHPQGHPGNSALPLVSVGGGINDEVKGPMRPTPFLERCPYIQQVLASLGTVIGRARLMRIAGQSDAREHVDTNYYWMHHVRVHIPAVTWPEVRFLCGGKSVHMAAGEAWIFDSWKRHNVLNPVETARIHLVADTVGSAHFWELVSRSSQATEPRRISFEPGVKVELEWEDENFPVVMSPFEQQALAARMLAGLPAEMRASSPVQVLEETLERLHQQWHALWTQFRDARAGWQRYAETMLDFDRRLPELAAELELINGVPLVEALRQAIVRPALSPEVARDEGRNLKPSAPPLRRKSRFERPVFIVSAPRAGSTMLFELLSRSPDVWTIGGESHGVIEGIPSLHPAQRGFESNRLTAADADSTTTEALQAAFLTRLRNREGCPWSEDRGAVRMLEKTPKNALRIPFLAEAFPDALFIFLHREPRESISSILDAWRSGRFVTYPQLPGWSGPPWSMLLVPGWRELEGKPLVEIAAHQWMSANERIIEDLSALPRERWCAVSYEEVTADPDVVAKRLSAFAGWRWDQQVVIPLPLSAHTLTPPIPEKWRRNETELSSVLPVAENVASRIQAFASGAALQPPVTPRREPAPPVAHRRAPATRVIDFDSQHTASFPELLTACGCSLAVSTYQAGKLILLRARDGVLNTHFRDFQSPMGIAWRPGWLAIGARQEVWTFRNFHHLGPKLAPDTPHDAVFLPGTRFTSGDIRIHEIGWVDDQLWAVNTRFSCLCTFDGEHNFVPRWRPPFITKLAADDRCHLNGMAFVDGRPAYVTCHGISDEPEGWREQKADGGAIIDINSGEILARELSMPHSPRFYDGRLWFLESGRGRVCTMDLDNGKTEVVTELPGFTRGLDFHGPFAFVGLSQVRESAVFSGIPISADDRQRECGVWVIDTRTGKTVAFLRFSGDVQEIFSLQVLPGIAWPELINQESGWIAGTFYLPVEAVEYDESAALS